MHELRKYRKERGISLAKLAARVGVSEGQLSRIERNESGVSLTMAVALEAETGIPAATFADRSSDERAA